MLQQRARARYAQAGQHDSFVEPDKKEFAVRAGYADYELRPGGDDVPITAANVSEYLAAVVDATLGSGIAAQVEAFRSGFNEVCKAAAAQCLHAGCWS